jgi:hypothetical protein
MAIELYRRCCAIFWLRQTSTRADKKGNAYSCELSYQSQTIRPASRYDVDSRFWDLYLTKFIPFPYDNNSMAYYKNIILKYLNQSQKVTYAWNKTAPEPQENKRAVFQSIQSYVFVAWFPDLSVAIRIYSLACLYNLKANRNQFSKYFEVYMVLKDDCTERPLLAIDVWSAEVETCNLRLFHPPLRLSISFGPRDQLRPGSFLPRRKSLGTRLQRISCLCNYAWLWLGPESGLG